MSEAINNFHLLSSKQRRFILNDEQVLSDLVRTNMSEKRFNHSLGTAKLAKQLAQIHHISPKKAWMAGILHDLAKEISMDETNEYLKFYDRDKLNAPDKVKHSFVCKYYLKDKLHIHDSDILNAVYNHTILKSNDKLSMILYIADKREENRKIDDEVVEVATKDLKRAVALLINKWKTSGDFVDGYYREN